MNKSLSEQLGEAYDKLETGVSTESVEIGREPEPVNEPDPAEQTASERLRDESGRFAKGTLHLKEGEKENAPQEPERTEKPAVEAQAKPEKENIPAPQEWKGNAKVDWARLPHEVKKALSEDYQSISQAKTVLPALEPYMQRFTQEFGGAPQALNAILSTWSYARQKPVDFVKEFIHNFQIDPRSLGFGQSPESPAQGQTDPQFAALLEKIAGLEGQLQQVAQQPLRAQEAQIDSEIRSFGSDPAHPYFNDVKPVMAALFQSGAAKTLQEAYEMAVYASPAIRSQVEAQRAESKRNEQRQAAVKATQAASSITGAPGVARPNAPQHKSIHDSLAAAYESQMSRIN